MPPRVGVSAEGNDGGRRLRAEVDSRLFEGPDRPHAHVLAVEAREPVGKRPLPEDPRELRGERLLVLVVLTLCELGPVDKLAEPSEEPRLEGRHRKILTVRRRVDPVTREPSGEHPRYRLAAQSVRDQVVRTVCHRDDDPGPSSSPLPLEQSPEHLDDRS